jgi:hypothetical protein
VSELDPKIINKFAKRIHATFHEDGSPNPAAADVIVGEIAKAHDTETLLAVLEEVANICRFEKDEADAEYARAQREHAELVEIHAGLPRTMQFSEACRIKAAQGNKAAQRWLKYWDSREHKLGDALLTAAIERHPGWRSLGNGHYRHAKGAPNEKELVEWFYKNHPLEAREIERRFPPEAR